MKTALLLIAIQKDWPPPTFGHLPQIRKGYRNNHAKFLRILGRPGGGLNTNWQKETK
jgi:hypothetical protein